MKLGLDVMARINATLLALALIAGASGQLVAKDVDLLKVDRSIRRETVWNSGAPGYCLLVILKGDAWDYVIPGETESGLSVVSAERRVWFVLDGDELYMDINENGDLTDPAEKPSRLELSDEERRKVNNQSLWQIPGIRDTDGKPLITNIQFNPRPGKGDPVGSARVCFSAPGRRDVCADPIVSDKPSKASIVHVICPYRLSLSVRKTFLSAHRHFTNDFHVDGHTYLEPLGPGSHYALEGAGLNCRIEYPMADGTIKISDVLPARDRDRPIQRANDATNC